MAATLTVRLEDEMLVALDRLAARMDCPRDGLIVRAVEDFVANDSWQFRKIEAALAAADAGEFATDDEIVRVKAKFSSRR